MTRLPRFAKLSRFSKLRSRHRSPVRLAIETLEGRTVPSTVNWINPAGGDWAVASNWDTGVVPGQGDDVVIDVPGNVTVTHTAGDDAVNSVICTDTLAVSGGMLTLASESDINNLTLSSGTVNQAGVLTIDGLFQWTAGTLGAASQVFGTATVIDGRLQITGPDAKTLADLLENAGNGTIDGGQILLQNGSFDNDANGTLTITHGDLELVGGAFNSGGFGNDGYLRVYDGLGVASQSFGNSGTIEVFSGGLGAGGLRGHFENTGTIQIWNGGMGFNGDSFESMGSISVAGDVSVYNGEGSFVSGTLQAGGNVSFSGWLINADSLDIAVGQTLAFDCGGYLAHSMVRARNMTVSDSYPGGFGFGDTSITVTLEFSIATGLMSPSVDFGSSTVAANTFLNESTLDLEGSAFSVRSFVNQGQVTMDAATTISTLEWFQNNGLVQGSGTIQGDFTNAGWINAGYLPSVPTALVITGNFYQTPTGHLDLALGLPNGGASASLQIDGDARLGGTISVEIDTVRAQQGDTYQGIAIGGTTIGGFNHYVLPPLDNNLVLIAVYDGSNLTFVVEQGG